MAQEVGIVMVVLAHHVLHNIDALLEEVIMALPCMQILAINDYR